MQKLYRHEIDNSIIVTYEFHTQREYMKAMRIAVDNIYEYINGCRISRKVTNISITCNYLMEENKYA